MNVKGPVALNVATTAIASPRVTVQGLVPEQPSPLQPMKLESASGVAVRVTTTVSSGPP